MSGGFIIDYTRKSISILGEDREELAGRILEPIYCYNVVMDRLLSGDNPTKHNHQLANESPDLVGIKLITSLSESIAYGLKNVVPPIRSQVLQNLEKIYSDESVVLEVINSASNEFFSVLKDSQQELAQMIESIFDSSSYDDASYNIYRNYVFFLLSSMIVDSDNISNLDELLVAAKSNVAKVPRVDANAGTAVLNGIYGTDIDNCTPDRDALDVGLKQMIKSLTQSHPQILDLMNKYLDSWATVVHSRDNPLDELSSLTFSILSAMCLTSIKETPYSQL